MPDHGAVSFSPADPPLFAATPERPSIVDGQIAAASSGELIEPALGRRQVMTRIEAIRNEITTRVPRAFPH